MLRSLVGSEMCIRDSCSTATYLPARKKREKKLYHFISTSKIQAPFTLVPKMRLEFSFFKMVPTILQGHRLLGLAPARNRTAPRIRLLPHGWRGPEPGYHPQDELNKEDHFHFPAKLAAKEKQVSSSDGGRILISPATRSPKKRKSKPSTKIHALKSWRPKKAISHNKTGSLSLFTPPLFAIVKQ